MSLINKSQLAGPVGPLQEEIIACIRSRGGEAVMGALANCLHCHGRDGNPSSTLRHSVGGLVKRGLLRKARHGLLVWYSEPPLPENATLAELDETE